MQITRILDFFSLPYVTAVMTIMFASFYLLDIIIQKRKMRHAKSAYVHFSSRNAQGVIFGKCHRKMVFSPEADEGHILVVGGSGTGKTSALLIPTLRSWCGTVFAIDISGDISANCGMENMVVFSPADSQTMPYDILHPIDILPNANQQDLALERLALMLLPTKASDGSGAAYFEKGGLDILQSALIAFYHKGLDFCEIVDKIVDLSYPQLFAEIDATQNQRAIRHINRFAGENENNISGCKGAAADAVSLFSYDEDLKVHLHRPKKGEPYINAKSVENSSVFLRLEQRDIGVYAKLTGIITNQIMEYLSNRPSCCNHNILLALDEFASLGKLDMSTPLRTYRKRHVRIMIITQSVADIDQIYGKDTRSVYLNNFAFRVILSATDAETQKYFADLLGQQSVEKSSVSYSGKRGLLGLGTATSTTIGQQNEYIIQPSEFAYLGDNLVLMFPDGYLKIQKNFYFKNRS